MKRRAFLKTAAALLPTAGLEHLAHAQASASAPPPHAGPISVVGPAQDRFGESHSLGFSTILFKVPANETNGGLFVIEHVHLLKGGPPLHMHLYQDEWFYVMEGEMLFQLGDQRKRLRSGESVLGPRRIPHTFTSLGETPGRMIIAFTPAGKMEQFFRDNAVPNAPPFNAELFRRYDMELLGPPLKAE